MPTVAINPAGQPAIGREIKDKLAARVSRLEIEAQIKSIANDCPFTMPFWLAELLQAECRRQGLLSAQYEGDDFSVSVKIKRARKLTPQAA